MHQGVSGKNSRHEIMAAEVKTDLNLLLECLQCHMGDVSVQRDTLLTAATLCSTSGEAQEYFRECGGINFVLNLLTSTEDNKVKIAALYMLGCACEKNVFSQKKMCTSAVFKFLYCQLRSEGGTSEDLRRTSAFLLLCLVTNNGEGQNFARTSHCLEALLKLFRSSYPLTQPTSASLGETWMDSDANHKTLELWTTVTSTLCGCVNNPQNEENQLMCSSIAFPAAINIISKTKNSQIIRLLSSFLSLTIASNGKNQESFGRLGGLEVLVDLLHTIMEELLQQPQQDAIQTAVQLANVFVSCVTDCEQNRSKLVGLNLVPMLVQLLSMDFVESDIRLKVILTLGHLTEKCGRSQRQLLESDGLSLLVHIMADNQDEEFNKAAMYLLTTCVDLVSGMEEGQNAGDGVGSSKKLKVADKRNKARAEREAAFIPIRNQQPEHVPSEVPSRHKKNEPDSDAVKDKVHVPAITDSKTCPASLSGHKINETTEEKLINNLLRQLHEEKSQRKLLENEKKALEKREAARERSEGEAKDLAEAITEELERQYKEQKHPETSGENRKQGDVGQRTKSVSSANKLPSPAMKNVQHRLEALEKSLNDISSMGNQLAEQIVHQARQKDRPTDNHNRRAKSTTVRPMMSDSSCLAISEDQKERDKNSKVRSEQLNRVDKHLSCNNGTGNVDKSQPVDGVAPLKSSSQPGQFRVPLLPVRRQNSGVAGWMTTNQRIAIDQRYPPRPNLMKKHVPERWNCGFKMGIPEDSTPYEFESDSESCVSDDVASLSSVTDSEVSVTASDMHLINQAQSTHLMPSTSGEYRQTTSHSHISSSQRRLNRSFRVDCSSKTGASFTLPASAQRSDLTEPEVSHLGVGKDNSRESKEVGGSRSDFSGCAPPINRPLLNSRNFVYTLERSPHTCSEHRELHRHIKKDINQRGRSGIFPESTRSTRSHLVKNLRSATRSRRSPLSPTSSFENEQDGQRSEKTMGRQRRRRQEFTQQEMHNLLTGVAKKGKHWNSILWAYKFAPGRTAVDLKEKYRRMQTRNDPGVSLPSSSASLKSFRRRPSCKIRDPTWRP